MPTRQLIQRSLSNIQPNIRVIDREHIDRLALVRDRQASTAGSAVPAADLGPAADVRGGRDLRLGCPAVFCCEAVDAVGAAGDGEGARGVVVAVVVAYGGGGGEVEEGGEEGEGGGRGLHVDCSLAECVCVVFGWCLDGV